ncbi:putative membrane protein [Emiliania huxleyi CCMP1516]|uniref:TLC domain-containing protein n=2 Tax=Emiliania huxleyi TaxID=2903 RepID=A0A0D3I759_EMIH1|nr:putative membrane protein [Emiliania huxleyi CCMP1516]EOD07094.1 putative membrane protein [Emiliania huxleyi CCMP1516]|eukprot:XP_005759523.1 putative membrane protein [Emiliania huxleyi CCMP1516]
MNDRPRRPSRSPARRRSDSGTDSSKAAPNKGPSREPTDAEFDASHKKLDTALLLCVIAVLVVMEEPATLVRDVTEAVLSAPRQFDFIESQTLNGSIAIGLSLLSLYSWALLYGVERTGAAVQRPWTAALHSAGSLLELGLGLCATLDLEAAASVVGPLEEGSYQVPWARASACVALAVTVPTGVLLARHSSRSGVRHLADTAFGLYHAARALEAARVLALSPRLLPNLWILLHSGTAVRLVGFFVTPYSSTDGARGDLFTEPLCYTFTLLLAGFLVAAFVYPPHYLLLSLAAFALANRIAPPALSVRLPGSPRKTSSREPARQSTGGDTGARQSTGGDTGGALKAQPAANKPSADRQPSADQSLPPDPQPAEPQPAEAYPVGESPRASPRPAAPAPPPPQPPPQWRRRLLRAALDAALVASFGALASRTMRLGEWDAYWTHQREHVWGRLDYYQPVVDFVSQPMRPSLCVLTYVATVYFLLKTYVIERPVVRRAHRKFAAHGNGRVVLVHGVGSAVELFVGMCAILRPDRQWLTHTAVGLALLVNVPSGFLLTPRVYGVKHLTVPGFALFGVSRIIEALRTLFIHPAHVHGLWILLQATSTPKPPDRDADPRPRAPDFTPLTPRPKVGTLVRLFGYFVLPYSSTDGARGDLFTEPVNYTLNILLSGYITAGFVYPPRILVLSLFLYVWAYPFWPPSLAARRRPRLSCAEPTETAAWRETWRESAARRAASS